MAVDSFRGDLKPTRGIAHVVKAGEPLAKADSAGVVTVSLLLASIHA